MMPRTQETGDVWGNTLAAPEDCQAFAEESTDTPQKEFEEAVCAIRIAHNRLHRLGGCGNPEVWRATASSAYTRLLRARKADPSVEVGRYVSPEDSLLTAIFGKPNSRYSK